MCQEVEVHSSTAPRTQPTNGTTIPPMSSNTIAATSRPAIRNGTGGSSARAASAISAGGAEVIQDGGDHRWRLLGCVGQRRVDVCADVARRPVEFVQVVVHAGCVQVVVHAGCVQVRRDDVCAAEKAGEVAALPVGCGSGGC